MANEFRIDYIKQLRAFLEVKLNTPGLTAGMISVYHALLDINNQSMWSEEFDVDFGYMLALSKVDKTTYYKAMDFFVENGIVSKYTKGLNAYTRAKVSLCLLYEKSTGNSLGKPEGNSLGNSLGESVSDHHYNKTLNTKLKKETINIPFMDFWNLYDNKIGKEKCEKKWLSLNDEDRTEIIKASPLYVRSTPEKKFRKHPLTYLSGKHWEDEIPLEETQIIDSSNNQFTFLSKPARHVNHQ